MNDPHVATLSYQVLESDSLEFSNPPDVIIDTVDFTGRLSAGSLTLEPKRHFECEADVRPIADAFARAWEISAGLDYGRPHFRFRFQGSQLIDRQPSPNTNAVHLSSHIYVSANVHTKLTDSKYPAPPHEFRLAPEVETMWERFCRYAEGQEPLLSMAYFCLTLLERGNRKAAAQHYGIHVDVLRKLGELTSTRGDGGAARKMTLKTVPLSGNETFWIEVAIKAIIRHIATAEAGKILTMTDLPELT